MDCSPSVSESKMYFIVVEKKILRDIASGIFKELFLLAEKASYDPEALKVIARYTDNLRKICE